MLPAFMTGIGRKVSPEETVLLVMLASAATMLMVGQIVPTFAWVGLFMAQIMPKLWINKNPRRALVMHCIGMTLMLGVVMFLCVQNVVVPHFTGRDLVMIAVMFAVSVSSAKWVMAAGLYKRS